MKLTEREKFLMKKSYLDGLNGYRDSDVWIKDIEAYFCGEADKEFPSIVKTVDPDNLPKDQVWAWCDEGLYIGYIKLNQRSEIVIDNYYETLNDPTHYIEQQDIYKLLK